MSSIRHITTQQFSDGTTIDGDRLERAVQDLENYMNDVPDGDFKQRWFENKIVFKVLPWTTSADAKLAASSTVVGNEMKIPYMEIYNSGVSIPGASNYYRLKGNKLPYQDGYSLGNQIAWTNAIGFGPEPVIIDSIDVMLMSYSTEYTNTFAYSSSPPTGKPAGAPIDNIHLQVTMDNPFLPNIQLNNSVLWHKYNFSALNSKFTARGLAYPVPIVSDMTPTMASIGAMGNGGQVSLAIQEGDLRIPVPPLSRLRFSLVIPDDGSDPWGARAWASMVPCITITILERLERD